MIPLSVQLCIIYLSVPPTEEDSVMILGCKTSLVAKMWMSNKNDFLFVYIQFPYLIMSERKVFISTPSLPNSSTSKSRHRGPSECYPLQFVCVLPATVCTRLRTQACMPQLYSPMLVSSRLHAWVKREYIRLCVCSSVSLVHSLSRCLEHGKQGKWGWSEHIYGI